MPKLPPIQRSWATAWSPRYVLSLGTTSESPHLSLPQTPQLHQAPRGRRAAQRERQDNSESEVRSCCLTSHRPIAPSYRAEIAICKAHDPSSPGNEDECADDTGAAKVSHGCSPSVILAVRHSSRNGARRQPNVWTYRRARAQNSSRIVRTSHQRRTLFARLKPRPQQSTYLIGSSHR